MKSDVSILVKASLLLKWWFMFVAMLGSLVMTSTAGLHLAQDPSRVEAMKTSHELEGSSPILSSNLDLWGPTSTDNINEILNALNNLENTEEVLVRSWFKLRQIYDGLGKVEQQMFLDASGFAIPDNWWNSWWDRPQHWAHWLTVHEVKAAWSTCYGHEDVGWNALVGMSLVDVPSVYNRDGEKVEGHLMMRKQLKTLGESISSEYWKDGNGIRVLDNDKALEVLRTDMFSDEYVEQIVHLRISDRNTYIPRKGLRRLKNLRYLELEVAGFTEEILEEETFPSNLVLLQWYGPHSSQLPFNPAHLNRLTVLRLGSYNTRHPWTLPDTFGELSSLKSLHIMEWKLESLPNTFGKLSRLQRLTISSCDSLLSLPETFAQLESLTHLTIEHCGSFERLPDSFGQLKALTHLTITDCGSFQSLAESFGHLKVLTHLTIESCSSFQSLPHSFGELKTLTRLRIYRCPSLQSLPDSFSQLTALKRLHLEDCGLQSLPDAFGQLSSLEHLIIGGCIGLKTLPESFKELSALQHLLISRSSLKRIADSMDTLPSTLTTVELDGMPFLQSFMGYAWDVVKFAESHVIFHLQDGRCILQEGDQKEGFGMWGDAVLRHKYEQKLGKVNEKVRQGDYKGALIELGSADLPLEPKRQGMVRGFFLLERAIVNRLAGDNEAALKDLDFALETKYKHAMHDYECRKQRGLLLFNMGELDAARIEGEKALEIEPYDLYSDFVVNIYTTMTWSMTDWRPSPCRAEQPVAYSNFRFAGKDTVLKSLHLLHGLQTNMMDKVWDMNYTGALSAVEADMMDVLYHSLPRRFQVQALRERGILKRLLGDLSGALADLTAAVEMATSKNGPDNYEARKHRGFVKYITGDLKGALVDAEIAVLITPHDIDKFEYAQESRKGGSSSEGRKPGRKTVLKFLGGEPLEYLGFNLK